MLPFLSTRLTGGQEGNDVKRLVPYCAAPVDGAIFPMMTLRRKRCRDHTLLTARPGVDDDG
jgi:hypothetical protein